MHNHHPLQFQATYHCNLDTASFNKLQVDNGAFKLINIFIIIQNWNRNTNRFIFQQIFTECFRQRTIIRWNNTHIVFTFSYKLNASLFITFLVILHYFNIYYYIQGGSILYVQSLFIKNLEKRFSSRYNYTNIYSPHYILY